MATGPGNGLPLRPGGVTKPSPEYGRGSHEIDAHSGELATPQQLQQMLLTIFQSPSYRPPVLPSVAIELSDLTRKQTVSYDDVVNVLQNDPLIVAGVLKVAQSPIYGGRSPVQSLKEAIQRLGINTLRDLVWQVVAGMRLFRVKGYTQIMERLQAHSVFTACLSRIVAARAGVAAEHAFLCGLLHDVGISGTLIALVEGEKVLPSSSALLTAVDGIHVQAGGMIAKLWGLSPSIASVIDHHHPVSTELAQAPALTAVLCIAERLADELGFSVVEMTAIEPFDRQAPDSFEHALVRLKLTAKQVELRERAKEVAEGMR